MKFLQLNKNEILVNLNNCSYNELLEFAAFIGDIAGSKINLKKIRTIRKTDLIDHFSTLLSMSPFVEKIYHKLSSSEASKFVYENLIWERSSLETKDVMRQFSTDFLSQKSSWGSSVTKQKDEFLFIQREESVFYNGSSDVLCLRGNFKSVLKMVFPVPSEMELFAIDDAENLDACFTYSNEAHIFNFINVISEMLKNNLVEFGKTNEKPLSKTLNMLKNSTQIEEFYDDKKLSLLATDMLTRSFSYYYWKVKGFKGREIDTLRNFLITQFEDKIDFFISRIFLSHLKKVRYDSWYSKQSSLFMVLKSIIAELPKDAWVDMSNIVKFCKYRDMRIDLDRPHKTAEYNLECEVITDNGVVVETFYADERDYNVLFLEPILKASFFYLGALGLFELKYDEPYSPYTISAKGKAYISPWDSLEFVKLSKLGEYIFGFSDAYEQKRVVKKSTALKFDEYKPIITIDAQDTLSLAKLESYCDKYDTNRYILSYAKIFKDCKNSKALEQKIEYFYKNIESNPPKVFQNFFDEIKQNANLLQRDLKQVVIKLDNNKKLLNLFMQNKKLQELIIKAQGYRVIVLKENIPKLTKIVKEHGFFVEF